MPLCDGLGEEFSRLSQQHENKLNGGLLLTSKVRFAYVDCATDKSLCKEQEVEDYPYLVHYRGGAALTHWASGSRSMAGYKKSMAKFVKKALQRALPSAGAGRVPPLWEELMDLVPSTEDLSLTWVVAVGLFAAASFDLSMATLLARSLRSAGPQAMGEWKAKPAPSPWEAEITSPG